MLSTAEIAVLDVFRSYHVRAGKMLCFPSSTCSAHQASLLQLTEKKLLVKEQFASGYSLTEAGYAAMTAEGNR